MPEAEAIPIGSERALARETEALVKQLDVGEEWTVRIQALLRLEGLVKGGAASLPGFSDATKALQAPVTAQLLDRSRVSRPAHSFVIERRDGCAAGAHQARWKNASAVMHLRKALLAVLARCMLAFRSYLVDGGKHHTLHVLHLPQQLGIGGEMNGSIVTS